MFRMKFDGICKYFSAIKLNLGVYINCHSCKTYQQMVAKENNGLCHIMSKTSVFDINILI